MRPTPIFLGDTTMINTLLNMIGTLGDTVPPKDSAMSILAGIISAVVVFTITAVKLVEKLIDYFINKKRSHEDKQDVLTERQDALIIETHDVVVKTYDILKRTDSDGTPLCYHPRIYLDHFIEMYKQSMDTQNQIVERLFNLTAEQKRLADIMDRLDRKIK